LYLTGWQQRDIFKIEKAAKLFSLNRSIALGPSYYFVIKDTPSEQALNYINIGLLYDPNATDLLQAKVKYSFMLGKNEEAKLAYDRLAILAPNSDIIDALKNFK
jgi:hypothetical protein